MSHYIVLGSALLLGVASSSVHLPANEQAQAPLSRTAAIAIAESHLAGKVRIASLEQSDGKNAWKVRIYTLNGETRGDFRIDAETGEVLEADIHEAAEADTPPIPEEGLGESAGDIAISSVPADGTTQGLWADLDVSSRSERATSMVLSGEKE